MQRKSGYPVSNCNIKVPDHSGLNSSELCYAEDDIDQQQRRQQLINFGHAQWGFNNWSWSVTKQELDFVDCTNGKYWAGVVAFVSITVKSFDIHRENIGYATSLATTKGFAIYKSRKSAVTNALRETLLSFGGSVATDLMELLESRGEVPVEAPVETAPVVPANNCPAPPAPVAVPPPAHAPVAVPPPAHAPLPPTPASAPMLAPVPPTSAPPVPMQPAAKELKPVRVARRESDGGRAPPPGPPPVALTHPMPAALPPPRAPLARAPPPRPNSNEPAKAWDASEEEARAERKRRQRQAQEEFRQRQLLKHQPGLGEKQDLHKTSVSFDKILLEIPSQDIVIQETADSVVDDTAKRKSPAGEPGSKRRASVINKLDIVQAD